MSNEFLTSLQGVSGEEFLGSRSLHLNKGCWFIGLLDVLDLFALCFWIIGLFPLSEFWSFGFLEFWKYVCCVRFRFLDFWILGCGDVWA